MRCCKNKYTLKLHFYFPATEFSHMQNERLYFQQWMPPAAPKAAIVLVHGLGEHCHRYQTLAAHLNNNAIALSSMDLPGHGQSKGKRGHINSFEDYQDAVLKLSLIHI